MKRLGKQDILAAKDRYYEDVESEAWGGIVRIAVITGTDRDRFEAITYPMKGKEIKVNREDIRARLLSLADVRTNPAADLTLADVDERRRTHMAQPIEADRTSSDRAVGRLPRCPPEAQPLDADRWLIETARHPHARRW